MISGEMLFGVNEFAIISVVIAFMLSGAELGFRIGRRMRLRSGASPDAQGGAMQAAVLGLLGLLLGFTFSMSVFRYDQRRKLVFEEVSAIEAAYLRAGLLEEPERARLETSLRDYLDACIQFHDAPYDSLEIQRARARAHELQKEFWSVGVASARERPSNATLGLLVLALNQAVAAHEQQADTFDDHVPESVLWLLFTLSTLSMGIVGYLNGLAARRHPLLTSVLTLMIALTIFAIIDIDRPRRGLILIGRKSLGELRERIH